MIHTVSNRNRNYLETFTKPQMMRRNVLKSKNLPKIPILQIHLKKIYTNKNSLIDVFVWISTYLSDLYYGIIVIYMYYCGLVFSYQFYCNTQFKV